MRIQHSRSAKAGADAKSCLSFYYAPTPCHEQFKLTERAPFTNKQRYAVMCRVCVGELRLFAKPVRGTSNL